MPDSHSYNPSESRFRAIFEQSPFSVQLLSPDGFTTHVNPAWKRLWGMSDEFIQSYILKDYNMLQDAQLEKMGIISYIRRGFAGEACDIPEIHYDPKANGMEGDARWISAMIFPLKDEHQAIREVVLIHIDSTASHEAREEQIRAAQVLKTLADTTAVLQNAIDPEELIQEFARSIVPAFADVCVVDLIDGGEIRRLVTHHFNPEKQRIADEIRRRFPLTLESPQPGMRVIRTRQPWLVTGLRKATMSPIFVNSDHARLASQLNVDAVLAVPLKIRDEVLGSISFALTEDHRIFDSQSELLGEELARRAAIAIDNARLYRNTRQAVQQRDEFISIASHELKTPLTTLKLQSQLAERHLANRPELGLSREYSEALVDTLNRQVDRLSRLIEDMLDISRIATGKLSLDLQTFDLSQLVDESITRFRVQVEADGIALRFASQGEAQVRADPVRIGQVLDNLLTNAIRYGNRAPIEVSVDSKEGAARVHVRDFGVGIAVDDHHRIFERFERASSVSLGGLGLGLYISRDIARAHGGEIRLESQLGQGSIFTLELPRV